MLTPVFSQIFGQQEYSLTLHLALTNPHNLTFRLKKPGRNATKDTM